MNSKTVCTGLVFSVVIPARSIVSLEVHLQHSWNANSFTLKTMLEMEMCFDKIMDAYGIQSRVEGGEFGWT